MTRLVVLDNAQLELMLRRADVLKAFPFMAAYTKVKKAGCGTCGGKKQRTNTLSYEQLKTAIGQLGPEQKIELKRLLQAENVRVKFLNVRGQTVRQTF